MKKLKLPSAHSILIIISLLVALMTWIIPAGQYDKLSYNAANKTFSVLGQEKTLTLAATQETLENLQVKIPIEKFTSGAIYKPIAIPHTYKKLESKPQGLAALGQAPIKGIIAAADIIFLVLIIGGLIGIMNFTGAFEAGISRLGLLLKSREYLLTIIITTLTAIGGTTFGMGEETMAFYPILIPVFMAAGYDALVGLASIFLGAGIGVMCSTTNPFATILASDAAGINWTSGLTNRLTMLVICLIISIIYILCYAQRVKADPRKSLLYDQKEAMEKLFRANPQKTQLNPQLLLILIIFSLSFGVMIIGVSLLHWWFVEMSTTFLLASILIAFIARMKESVFVEEFVKGAGDLLGVAFIIGIARGITILMEDGLISDTILFYSSTLTEGMNKGLFANVLLFVFGGLSFFMPSTSGMAVLTMPVIAPLAETVAIGRETVVDSYLYGMGMFNLI
ncbi:MAG: YfcC family protein, partial [Bacteroidota bacterium]